MFSLKSCFILLYCVFVLFLACGEDSLQEPDDSLPSDTTGADTTGADTTGVDTTALKTPYMIPLAPGAKWKYSLHFISKRLRRSSTASSEEHYGTYSMEVLSADLEKKTYVLKRRFTLDSLIIYSAIYSESWVKVGDTTYTLFPGIDVLPVNPDTSCTWNIVTLRDTVFYSFGQDLHYFMPWSIKGLSYLKLNLRIMEYPWENSLDYYTQVSDLSKKTEPVAYSLGGLVAYGDIDGNIIPNNGGIADFSVFYSPAFADVTLEYLTYKLLEYTPGVIPE
jgi:hypothetical protein